MREPSERFSSSSFETQSSETSLPTRMRSAAEFVSAEWETSKEKSSHLSATRGVVPPPVHPRKWRDLTAFPSTDTNGTPPKVSTLYEAANAEAAHKNAETKAEKRLGKLMEQ